MRICYLGNPPLNYPVEVEWRKWGEGPVYEIDGLVLFDTKAPLSPLDFKKALLAQRHGRTIIYFGEHDLPAPLRADHTYTSFNEQLVDTYVDHIISSQRTNYEPIDCNFYDNFEAAITERRPVRIEFRETDGTSSRIETRLLNTMTNNGEEYIQFRDGTWLRLDRVVSVDGVAAGASCQF
ncbi:hypothetical protein [Neolewinella antarctica]|uniref:Transcriptional antiterminator Rof (Rho-off) n=1 Tax=Neolewinella antarctica TaxID=442734 RepID=A0ABX0XGZ5_9BACT|nr:hypothetical protein [Neolewinella antarctica]NJC28482.1 transcriptional antiterminator Rof (Rho-off) [Neolewinella antarctica]